MQIDVDEIRISNRARRDVGNLSVLMESMRKHGQLCPIIVNRDRELIAGYRRLAAARQLGWHSIAALIVDQEHEADRLELELEENIQRKQLTFAEISDGFSRLERLRRPHLLRRILMAIQRFLRLIVGRFRAR